MSRQSGESVNDGKIFRVLGSAVDSQATKWKMRRSIAMIERTNLDGGVEPLPGPARGDALGLSNPLARIAVRSMNRIVIVQVADIICLDAEDNYVKIRTDRSYLHKETLTRLMSRLDPTSFLRVHRSHAVNLREVRELRPQVHGEYAIVLSDGTELMSGRSYKNQVRTAFALD
jgi:DNA-binding LytR/AlgR family response regulator